MPISDESIDDFIARWKRAFGEELSRDEARLQADRVLHLYRRMLKYQQDNRDIGDVARDPMPQAEAQVDTPDESLRDERAEV